MVALAVAGAHLLQLAWIVLPSICLWRGLVLGRLNPAHSPSAFASY
jgi:hypothetical protein